MEPVLSQEREVREGGGADTDEGQGRIPGALSGSVFVSPNAHLLTVYKAMWISALSLSVPSAPVSTNGNAMRSAPPTRCSEKSRFLFCSHVQTPNISK